MMDPSATNLHSRAEILAVAERPAARSDPSGVLLTHAAALTVLGALAGLERVAELALLVALVHWPTARVPAQDEGPPSGWCACP
jgi:hypothetical protein